MISLSFKLLIVASALMGIIFFKRQNAPGRLGGPICKAKGFWLYYTIFNWFFVLPFALYQLGYAPASHRSVWFVFTISMWIRGIAEIYMLFVTKNWTPVIGISHDVFTLFLMLLAPIYTGGDFFQVEAALLFYTLSLYLSIGVETYYAWSFFQLMKGRTQGEDGMWYAHEDDPRFKRIILITTIFNYILYAALGAFLWKYLL